MRRQATTLVAVALLVSACSRSRAEELRPAPPSPGPSPSPSVAPAPAPFVWQVQVDSKSTPASAKEGSIHVALPGWRCDYAVEPGTPREERGWLRCEAPESHATVETMVLCLVHDQRPSDCGTGALSIANRSGRPVNLGLNCKSPGSDCFERPPLGGDAGLAPPGVGVPFSGRRLRGADGRPYFRWTIEAAGQSPAFSPEDAAGAVRVGLTGFDCRYLIEEQKDPVYPRAEVGRVSCTSKRTGERAEVALPCAENEKLGPPTVMGSLVIAEEGAEKRNVLLSCRR